jgi:hypothetical protein
MALMELHLTDVLVGRGGEQAPTSFAEETRRSLLVIEFEFATSECVRTCVVDDVPAAHSALKVFDEMLSPGFDGGPIFDEEPNDSIAEFVDVSFHGGRISTGGIHHPTSTMPRILDELAHMEERLTSALVGHYGEQPARKRTPLQFNDDSGVVLVNAVLDPDAPLGSNIDSSGSSLHSFLLNGTTLFCRDPDEMEHPPVALVANTLRACLNSSHSLPAPDNRLLKPVVRRLLLERACQPAQVSFLPTATTVKETLRASFMCEEDKRPKVPRRHNTEVRVCWEADVKVRALDAISNHNFRYRKNHIDEIEMATERFSDDLQFGEGGYDSIYRASMGHTPIAIKGLRPDARSPSASGATPQRTTTTTRSSS